MKILELEEIEKMPAGTIFAVCSRDGYQVFSQWKMIHEDDTVYPLVAEPTRDDVIVQKLIAKKHPEEDERCLKVSPSPEIHYFKYFHSLPGQKPLFAVLEPDDLVWVGQVLRMAHEAGK